jgi:hypothetical protein
MRRRLQLAVYYKIKAPVCLAEHVFSFRGEYAEEVKQKFVTAYPENGVPHRSVLHHSIRKFRGTRSVAEAPKSGRPKDEVVIMSDRIMKSPEKSLRKFLGNRCVV